MSSVVRIFRGRPIQVSLAIVLAATTALALATRREKPAATAPTVVVALPAQPEGNVPGRALRYPVEVASRYANSMSFRVPGKLIERSVRLGDTVRKGQVVARLDALDARKQLAAAEAAFAAADHRQTFAKQQLDRDTAQIAQNLVARAQFEATQDAYSAARAAREQAAAQLVIARNNLEYQTLVADHDGLITIENADTGQVVASGQPVFGLAWSGDLDLLLDAAAADVGGVSVGQAASVIFPALPGQRFEARVREVSPSADPQSRTYRVKLTLDEPSAAIRLGMTGDAWLAPGHSAAPVASAQTFTIPATALFHRGKEPAVWVVRGGDSTLELRAVRVQSYRERSALVTGLQNGDLVVQAGVHTVYEGEHVKPVKPLFAGGSDEQGVSEPSPLPTGGAAL
jgi:membrane fusion protein, multidrug efflux system